MFKFKNHEKFNRNITIMCEKCIEFMSPLYKEQRSIYIYRQKCKLKVNENYCCQVKKFNIITFADSLLMRLLI